MTLSLPSKDADDYVREEERQTNRQQRFGDFVEISLHGVYEISKILASPARLETTLGNVLNVLSSFLAMRHGAIALLDDLGAAELVVGSAGSVEAAKVQFENIPERAIGQIVTTKMPVVVEDTATSPLFAEWIEPQSNSVPTRICFVGVPIKESDRVVGTITIDRLWDGGADFRIDEDVRFLVMVANLVGQTLRLHRVVARDRERLMTEQHRLAKELSETNPAAREPKARGILGESQSIRSVLDKIGIVARTNSTVLLRGESGTGKELFARATHDLSSRKKGPFIKLNCAALPESVLESELFGHEKGAFTGALALRKGRFELADRGTLFLDEIGEISPSFQAKLLRVLQEGEFERVGGMRTLKVDVRLVAATNKNLEQAVSKGEFRADLYYRINVVSISLPPLRDRPDDVVLLANEFLLRFNEEHGTDHSLTPSADGILQGCYFPGNVRELENCVRRTATLAKGDKIVANDFACRHGECLSSTLWKGSAPVDPISAPRNRPQVAPKAGEEEERPRAKTGEHQAIRPHLRSGLENTTDRDNLLDAMEKAGWVQAKAARILNITTRQIGYALRKHNIPIKRF
ncbi:nif-specific transcriptional activator NifA [Methylocapsa palsarum]|uniref:Nif-specific regulatory protein n=1 Tax=Methylocapsa palsarum TaxID=1612308 RepID=A0A1I4CXX0_9HYPH|nr:nif-specific transcriptional activator NifA [Methylocapsa palsarum]SFK86092.1 Nif-specific regulatory protein [Methylocapsa palsarum]